MVQYDATVYVPPYSQLQEKGKLLSLMQISMNIINYLLSPLSTGSRYLGYNTALCVCVCECVCEGRGGGIRTTKSWFSKGGWSGNAHQVSQFPQVTTHVVEHIPYMVSECLIERRTASTIIV